MPDAMEELNDLQSQLASENQKVGDAIEKAKEEQEESDLRTEQEAEKVPEATPPIVADPNPIIEHRSFGRP